MKYLLRQMNRNSEVNELTSKQVDKAGNQLTRGKRSSHSLVYWFTHQLKQSSRSFVYLSTGLLKQKK